MKERAGTDTATLGRPFLVLVFMLIGWIVVAVFAASWYQMRVEGKAKEPLLQECGKAVQRGVQRMNVKLGDSVDLYKVESIRLSVGKPRDNGFCTAILNLPHAQLVWTAAWDSQSAPMKLVDAKVYQLDFSDEKS